MSALTRCDVVFDMETQDPDDYLTLLLLLGHPMVNLKGVTIMPGSPVQVGLVRRTLDAFDKAHVPVGAYNLDHPKACLSPWHERAYGAVTLLSRDAEPAGALLAELCDANTTLLTGAPIKNLGEAMKFAHFHVGRWVAQGGFAGEGVVPKHLQLPKFAGKRTCATFNLNGAPKVALSALEDDVRFGERLFVSKNVCHGVVYDAAFHALVGSVMRGHQSLEWIYKGMEHYLSKRSGAGWARGGKEAPQLQGGDRVRLLDMEGKSLGVMSWSKAEELAQKQQRELFCMKGAFEPPLYRMLHDTAANPREGKKLHDPLAACCAICPEIGTWVKVDLLRERGEWGARPNPESKTSIIIDYDEARFKEVFTMSA